MVASVKAKTFDVALSETKMLVGTPAEVLEQLRLVLSWYGDVEPSLQVNFGNMPFERARRTMQLFADEVLPAFETVGSVH